MELEGLRKLVADCVEKHCYRSAIFFGDKVCLLSGEEDRDVYQLCQAYIYSGQHGRALNRLTRHRESRDGEGRGADWEGHKSFRYLAARCLAESQEWERCLQTLDEGENGGTGQYSEPPFAGGGGGGGSAGANTDAFLVLPGMQSKETGYFLWPLAYLGCHDSR